MPSKIVPLNAPPYIPATLEENAGSSLTSLQIVKDTLEKFPGMNAAVKQRGTILLLEGFSHFFQVLAAAFQSLFSKQTSTSSKIISFKTACKNRLQDFS